MTMEISDHKLHNEFFAVTIVWEIS